VSLLEVGCSDGVAFVRGRLRRLPGAPDFQDPARVLQRLEQELRSLEGVSSLVLEPEGFEKVGNQWRSVSTKAEGSASS
jgi:hypothetical protein